MKKYIILFISLSTSLSSCKLEEGKGGQAEISGRVLTQIIYSNPILGIKDSVLKEYPTVNTKVFIKYGDNTIFDNDTRTDDQGYYKFIGLTKGDYEIITYSYCVTCNTETSTKSQKISLETHKEKKQVATFYVIEN